MGGAVLPTRVKFLANSLAVKARQQSGVVANALAHVVFVINRQINVIVITRLIQLNVYYYNAAVCSDRVLQRPTLTLTQYSVNGLTHS